MTDIRTFCRVCEPACGLVATVEDGTLQKLRPDRTHPVTKGFACNKGLAGVEIHLDPDRLAHPLRRGEDGRRERIGWDVAIDEIAGKLRGIVDRYGAGAASAYIGNPTAFNTLAGPAAGAFFAQLGVRRQFSSGTQDCANKFAGSEAVFGTSTCHPVPDFAHTDFLLIFGANPRVSHASFISVPDPMRWLKDAKKRGAKIWFVNPREIESSGEETGETIRIRPDTDVYFMAALLHELDRIGGFDEEVLAEHGKNVAGLREFVARYDAERQAAVTGVPAPVVREVAREMAAADSAAVHMSTGVNMGRQGTLAYWLLHMLSFATGNLDRRGGNILSVGFYNKAVRAGRGRFADGFVDTEWGRLRRGALPGNLMADAILSETNPVRALFVVAGNPLLSIGGEERMREALEKLELLVVIDLYQNATGEYADYLLPSTDAFERADVNITGLGLQEVPWIQFTDPVVPARDERREEWWIFARLAQAMGLKSPLDAGPEPDLFGRIDHMLKSTGHSLAELRELGGVLPLEPLAPGRFFSEQIQTEYGKVDCCPPAFADAIARADAIYAELAAEGLGRLKLITRRDPYMHNSWYQNLPSMKRGERDRNRLYVHPEDARERGLADGAKVRVANEHGALDVEILYDAGLMRGVVALTHGWGNKQTSGMRFAARTPGVNANALLPSGPGSFEPLSSQAFMTGIPVELDAL
jgi:anaerobic selenocysteine-containing dehydrogenase